MQVSNPVSLPFKGFTQGVGRVLETTREALDRNGT
jgi:hypothetical protein